MADILTDIAKHELLTMLTRRGKVSEPAAESFVAETLGMEVDDPEGVVEGITAEAIKTLVDEGKVEHRFTRTIHHGRVLSLGNFHLVGFEALEARREANAKARRDATARHEAQ